MTPDLTKLRDELAKSKDYDVKRIRGLIADLIKDKTDRNLLFVCLDSGILREFFEETKTDEFFNHNCFDRLKDDHCIEETKAEKAIHYCQFLTNKVQTPIKFPKNPFQPTIQPTKPIILQPIVQPQPKPVPVPTPTPLPKVPVPGKPKRTLARWLLLIVVIIVVGIVAIYWPKTTADVQTIVQGTPISKNPEAEKKRIADSLDTAKKLAAREKAVRDAAAKDSINYNLSLIHISEPTRPY